MKYVDLYNFAEKLIRKRMEARKKVSIVSVHALKDELKKRVDWIEDINFYPVQCKIGDPFGHYECYGDQESRWEDPDAWVVLITYDETLNFCQSRFVWCKELMHIFDTEDGSVKSEEEYKGFLREIEIKPLDPSEKFLSENTAKWMALLILCPKPQRDEAMRQMVDDELSEYDIALKFRIPESVVTSLFSVHYEKAYEALITNE